MNVYLAMTTAIALHQEQKRAFTNEPYYGHLAEVVGFVSSFDLSPAHAKLAVIVAWLHDSMEDQGHIATYDYLRGLFGVYVADGVDVLTKRPDPTKNRAQRHQEDCARLAAGEQWLQEIKAADHMSNVKGIVSQSAKFAAIYLPEKQNELDAMTKIRPRIRDLVQSRLDHEFEQLKARK